MLVYLCCCCFVAIVIIIGMMIIVIIMMTLIIIGMMIIILHAIFIVITNAISFFTSLIITAISISLLIVIRTNSMTLDWYFNSLRLMVWSSLLMTLSLASYYMISYHLLNFVSYYYLLIISHYYYYHLCYCSHLTRSWITLIITNYCNFMIIYLLFLYVFLYVLLYYYSVCTFFNMFISIIISQLMMSDTV